MSKPLHPKLKRYLKMAYANGLKNLNKISENAIGQSSSLKKAPLDTIKKTTYLINHHFSCDVFSKEGNTIMPLLLFFPASGWIFNCQADSESFCRYLANILGFKVIVPHFELAPQRKFLALLSDAKLLCEWVKRNTDVLGVEENKIYGWGESSGGHLLACVSHVLKKEKKSIIQKQILVYPLLDFVNSYPSKIQYQNGYLLDADFLNHLLRQMKDDSIHFHEPVLSPMLYDDFGDLPETVVITAEYDPSRDEAEHYAKKLKEAGVNITCQRYDGMIHGFLRFIDRLEEANAAVAFACAHLKNSHVIHHASKNF